MRTITAAQQAVLDSGVQADFVRVSIKDSGGTFRDLTTYPGYNAVKSVTWSEKIDDPHMTCEVVLLRELHRLSLSPFMTASALNKGFDPSASFAALIALAREVKIEVAIVAMGKRPASGDWFEVFRGRVDTFDAANGKDLQFSCRGLAGRLAQQFIKVEYVYAFAADGSSVTLRVWEPQMAVKAGSYVLPASRGTADPGFDKFLICDADGSTGTTEPIWTSGAGQTDGSTSWTFIDGTTTAGRPVEEVIQNILDDNKQTGDSTVTLYTPSSPGWDIRQFIQQRTFTLDAIKALSGQIGWDLRSKWRAGTAQFELTLYQPERASPTVVFTFQPGDYGIPDRLAVDIAEIRNSWRVIYADRADLWPDGTPKRKVVEVSDATSIGKYNELFAEMQEDETGNIDSVTEATALANAALSDCKEPTAEFSVPLARGFPWVELNDFYTFKANALHFDSDQSLAATGWTQSFEGGKLATKLDTRGKPTIGAQFHIDRSTHPRILPKSSPHQIVQFQGTQTPTLVTSDTVGGTRITIDQTEDKHHLPDEFEIHLSKTQGFVPDSSSLVAVTKSKSLELSDLIPATTYYTRAAPRYRNSDRLIRGQPSVETSFIAGQGGAGHLKQDVEWGRLPLNGGFETWNDTTKLPDHWTTTGVFGTNITRQTGNGGVSGDSWLRYVNNFFLGPFLLSTVFTVERNVSYDVGWWVNITTPGSATGQLQLGLRWLDYLGAFLGDVVADFFLYNAFASGTWFKRSGVIDAPDAARFAQVFIVAPSSFLGTGMETDIDSVRVERA